MATVIVATDESYFDKKTDAFKSETEWHKLKFFQPKHVQKCEALMPGSRLYIEGHRSEIVVRHGNFRKKNTVLN